MKTVTINFAGGAPLVLEMQSESVPGLFDALSADPRGTTRLTGDNGVTYLINRAQLTHADAE